MGLSGLGNVATKPWEQTEVPGSGALLYQCIGSGWHTTEYHDPDDLTWMKGELGTDQVEDGFYCGMCVWTAEKQARKGRRPTVVLGPTLEEELERRRATNHPWYTGI